MLYMFLIMLRAPDSGMERLHVRMPAGTARKSCFPELTLCPDSYSMSVPPPVLPQWHAKVPGHYAKGQVASYT